MSTAAVHPGGPVRAARAPEADAQRPILRDLLPGVGNLMVSFLLFFVWFIPMIVLLAIGVGLTPLFGLGLVVLWLVLHVIRGQLGAERARARAVYGLPVRDLAEPHRSPSDGWFRRALAPFTVPEFWRSFLHHGLKILLGLITVSLAIILIGTGLGSFGILGTDAIGYRILPGLTVGTAWAIPAGIVAAILGLLILWVGVLADRMLDATMISGSEQELREEVVALTGAHDAAERAAETERRRLERDLHDGAQPRLVNLAMTLGMAKAKMESDPAAARAMIDEAHAEAKAAVNDLRQLARGIHPAVLTDRGLDAALSALAARTPVPVRVRVDLDERPHRSVESVAYFVAAEALTNVAKHSGATRADVVVTRDGDTLRIMVMDDGRGGAALTRDPSHTGLAGLAERVRSARGTLTLTSPDGGPTIITVELPCA
ncbi:MAG: histidine kinase [bacterium]|nr:histidine kinase [bacterium]